MSEQNSCVLGMLVSVLGGDDAAQAALYDLLLDVDADAAERLTALLKTPARIRAMVKSEKDHRQNGNSVGVDRIYSNGIIDALEALLGWIDQPSKGNA